MDEVVDAVFAIECRSLPVDHAYALFQAIQAVLPWFADEPQAGLHTVHGAASGAGWKRPEGADALLQLPRRTRLVLRLPGRRMADAAALTGRTLDVAGCPLRVEKMARRPLSRITTLFSRQVVLAEGEEVAFVGAASEALGALGVIAARMVCGRVTPVATPERTYQARSLMLAGLTLEHSLLLQQRGLGAGRKLGCGVFIPHKDIADLRSRPD
jgi:CRISPR-associated protein Cas6